MICHNASSNLRLRSGVAPLNHWAARGVKWRWASTRPASTTTATCSRRCASCCACTACPAWTTPCPRAPRCSAWRRRTAPPPRRMPGTLERSHPARPPTSCCCRGRRSPIRTSIRTRRWSTPSFTARRRPAWRSSWWRARSCSAMDVHASRQGSDTRRTGRVAPRAAHARGGGPPPPVARGIPRRQAILRWLARRGRPRAVLPAEFAHLRG